MAALNREVVDAGAVRESLATMIRAAEDGAEGVRRLLLFARPSVDGPAGRVELDEVLRETAKLTAPRWRDAAQQQGRPISVDLEVEGDVAIDGWASDLREAFANLVLNAVDALPRGGVIRLAARSQAGRVIAEVADDGVGMSAQTPSARASHTPSAFLQNIPLGQSALEPPPQTRPASQEPGPSTGIPAHSVKHVLL